MCLLWQLVGELWLQKGIGLPSATAKCWVLPLLAIDWRQRTCLSYIDANLSQLCLTDTILYKMQGEREESWFDAVGWEQFANLWPVLVGLNGKQLWRMNGMTEEILTDVWRRPCIFSAYLWHLRFTGHLIKLESKGCVWSRILCFTHLGSLTAEAAVCR